MIEVPPNATGIYNREYRDDTKEQRADHCDLADDLADIGRGRFARTDARNRTVVVFDVVCNLNRVVLHRNIEVVEPDNQNEIENAVEPVGRRQP